MNYHPPRLVYYNDVPIFKIHIQRNILWFDFNSFHFRYEQCDSITFGNFVISLDGLTINRYVFIFYPQLNLTTRNIFTKFGFHIFVNAILLRCSIGDPFKGGLFQLRLV
ncbi:hypothetical protein D3C81_1528280 [compost metagenome]